MGWSTTKGVKMRIVFFAFAIVFTLVDTVADGHDRYRRCNAIAHRGGFFQLRAGFSEEELSYDRRSTTLAAFAARHGFAAETASRVLQIDLPNP